MARITCQAALGCGGAIGAGVHAAQWSFAPTMTWELDDDSNRYLTQGASASQGAIFNPSAVLERATDTTQLSLTPWLMWERIDDPKYADQDNRSLAGAFNWTTERGQLQTQASLADLSSLQSELTETGIIANDLRQRNDQASGTWTYGFTERHALLMQLSWTDVSYYGTDPYLNLLDGYRYPTASAGDQFTLSPNTTLTASLFDDELLSHLPHSDSHEAGVRLEVLHHFTERTQIDAYVGESERSLRGSASRGTLGSITGTWQMPRGHLDLSFSDTLVPYGTGVLVQRAQASLSQTINLTETVDAQLALTRIQNNASTVALLIDRRYYDNATATLNWQWDRAWRVRVYAGITHTQTLPVAPDFESDAITGWRTGISAIWTPEPVSRSF